MVEDFHRRSVRVFFPSMPWDTGTRDVAQPYWSATAQLMAEMGADGVNGDTFDGMPRAYRTASDQSGHPVVFEPEGSPRADEQLMWNNQSWGYWKFPFAPMVSKLKWLEPRHMINVCDRWARDKTDNLQAAFFNGVGYESWENIWGIWNQIAPRDAEALRRVAYIERQFAALLVARDWEPYAPTLQYGVFATRFPSEGRTLWTVVNRNEYGVSGGRALLRCLARRRNQATHRGRRRGAELRHGSQRLRRDSGGDARRGSARSQRCAGADAPMGGHAAGEPFARVELPAAADGGHRAHPTALRKPAGHGACAGRRIRFPSDRH
jgi:hypothetical protein